MKAQLDKEVQFITDHHGNRTAAVIPIERWTELVQQYEADPSPLEEAIEPEAEQADNTARQGRDKKLFKEALLQSLRDVKAHQQGKLKLKSAREFLDEL